MSDIGQDANPTEDEKINENLRRESQKKKKKKIKIIKVSKTRSHENTNQYNTNHNHNFNINAMPHQIGNSQIMINPITNKPMYPIINTPNGMVIAPGAAVNNPLLQSQVAQLNLQNQNHNQNLQTNQPNQVVIPLNRTKSGESNYSLTNNRQESSLRKKKKMATPTNSVPNIVVVKTNIRGSKSLSLMNPAVKKISLLFFLKNFEKFDEKSPFFYFFFTKNLFF